MFGRGLGLEQWNAFDLSPAESGGPESRPLDHFPFFSSTKTRIEVRAPILLCLLRYTMHKRIGQYCVEETVLWCIITEMDHII